MASVVPLPPSIDELPPEVLAIGASVSTSFVDPLELQNSIQRAGRALLKVIDAANLSSECQSSLAVMAASGQALELRFVEEIQNTVVLAGPFQESAVKHIAELRETMANCATKSSVPVVELLSLWSVVHASVSDVITGATNHEVLETVDDIGDNAKAIGKLLTAALASSSVLSSSVSDELREALRHLTETGTPVADHLVKNLHQQIGEFREVLSEQDWNELRSRCSQSITSEWKALGDAVDSATDQAKEATGFIKLTASEIFDSPYAKAIAAQGFAGMDGVLGQSRDVIDAALDAVRDGGTAAFSAFAACLARSGLPPLLRVEIARDFFQTVGLFFNGLYVSVLDFFGKHQVANGLNNFLKGLRGAYDVMAVNVLALIDKASQNRALLVDFAVGILLTAIGVVYVSFLWFAFSGRYLHRRADEVRQGHEAVTWAVLAKKQKMRVKIFTYVITVCLTVYLPLTRLCLDVLVAAAMNRSTSDDSEATSASDLILSRFKDAKAWPAIVVAAVVLLMTFTIPLPWLLVRAIAENRPTGSLEDPLVTHDLDGEIVPFDDKVYARLVARDPSQLRCPYRSLYAGFEQKLEALEQAVVASGVRRVRSHWTGEEHPYTSKLRQATRSALEGVDVFWDDASGARDGHLDSKSFFGKMYVLPYPFHCVMVYDDSKDEAVIRDEAETPAQSKLAKLLFLNFSPKIVAKRDLRQKLRVLSAQAINIDFPFSRQEQATVEDDGHGDAVAPHTGKVHHLQNRVDHGPDHIGLSSTMDESEQLRTIFEQTKDVWGPGVKELREQQQQYRRELERKHAEANATLSDAFWYFVYNNPHISRQELEFHLKHREGNPQLQSLTETHQSALDSLYLRIKFIHSHPAVTFWFVFWDDVYARNGEMKGIRKCKADFEPLQPTAICYHVMRRPDLESWLCKRRLVGNHRLFHSRLLDLLYSQMNKRLEDKNA
ncbi:hypothetical protein GQ600_8740 [Phytophthora cactorum]|nr:hypothetical protein GQ600_8740 [Phytophthora cactorum]